MKTLHFVLLWSIVAPFISIAQQQPIIEYDFNTQTYLEWDLPNFDPNTVAEHTPFYTGTTNPDVAWVDELPPTQNLFRNTQYTYKERSQLFFDLSQFPMSSSAKTMYQVDGVWVPNCSCNFISQRHVLTAAHCLVELNGNSVIIDSLAVFPAYDNDAEHPEFGYVKATKAYFFKDWTIMGNDLAILELEEPIGLETGWIGIGYAPDSYLLNELFYKFSYPGVTMPVIDSNVYESKYQYYSYGVLDFVNDNFIGILNGAGIPGESGSSFIKITNEEEYISYGTATLSLNLSHSRIDNWEYYAFKEIINQDAQIPPLAPNFSSIVYPNPFISDLTVEFDRPIYINTINIYNTLGQLVSSKTVDAEVFRNDIQLDELPLGNYFLQIDSNYGQITHTISKQ